MKRSSILLFYVFAVFHAAVAQDAQKLLLPADDYLTIAFFQPDTTANPVEGNAAMRWWGDLMSKEIGKRIETRFFVNLADFENYLDTNKVEIAILNPLYIIENHKKRNIVPKIIAIRAGKPYYERAIIVGKDKEIKDIADLQGGILITTQLGDRIVDFIETIEFQGKINLKKTFSKVILETNPRFCLSKLTEKQADAALIPLKNYEILMDLLPDLRKSTRVLRTSQKIPLAAGCYFADVTNEQEMKPIFEAALNIHKTPTGQQAMMIFKAERWEEVSMKIFQPLVQALQKSHND
ncbi:phosphate/phosphite/phosphonate ABC transporter substrate-binding protein [candidate division CSSED10-310 bacterium]|uniref:Phosphate/phosphite/phosphonate ABC transporter substrate-binding protein n=1 Tax=candidate division CSSED10-310 bacterium TaxID=2855610 RepID=A0ABV6YYU4_UNCC1